MKTSISILFVILAATIFLYLKQPKSASKSHSPSSSKRENVQGRIFSPENQARVSTVLSSNQSGRDKLLTVYNDSSTIKDLISHLTILYSEADEDELEVFKKELKAKGWNNWHKTGIAFDLLYERWAQLDSQGALSSAATAVEMKQEQHVRVVLGELFAKNNPDEVWSQIMNLKNSHARQMAQEMALEMMVTSDPKKALALLKDTKGIPANRLFRKWAESDPESAFEEAKKIKGFDRVEIWQSIYAEWFQKDPEEAFAQAGSMPQSREKNQILMTLAQEFAKKDAKGAAEWALKNRDQFDIISRGSFIDHLSENDPAFAAQWIHKNQFDPGGGDVLALAAERWMQADFTSAKAWLDSVQNIQEKSAIIGRTFEILAQEAPDQLVSLINNVGEHNLPLGDVSVTLLEIGRTDIEQALKLASAFKQGASQIQIYPELLTKLSQFDPNRAWEIAQSLDQSQSRRMALASIAAELASNNPKEALKFLDQLPEGSDSNTTLQGVFAGWASSDPKGAMAKAMELENPLHRDLALDASLSGWWRGTEEQVDFLLSLPPSEVTESYAKIGDLTWAKKDPEAALEKVIQSPSNSLSQNLAVGIFETWSSQNPIDAANALVSGKYQNVIKDEAFHTVASGLTAVDREASIVWAESLADKNNQGYAYAGIVEKWAQEDPYAAAEWIGNIEEGESRDFAVNSYIRELNSIDPQSSLEWVDLIADSKNRWETTKDVLRKWHGRDRQAAEDWMSENQFSAEQTDDVFNQNIRIVPRD